MEEVYGEVAGRVTNVLDETREAIRAIILKSFRKRIDPKTTLLKELKETIGLSTPAAQAVASYRLSLEEAGFANVDEQVAKYSKRKIRERAETIARTETMTILNAGQELSWLQADDEGYFEGMDMERLWIVTPDEKLCEVCEPMTGVSVLLGEDFPIAGPPAHPRCRCTEGLRERR
jgi:hypothetical protein